MAGKKAAKKSPDQVEPQPTGMVDDGGIQEDPLLDKMVLVFLVIFLLAVIFIPQDWFLNWSMWWNGIK
ncbi:hypothetical protein JW905_02410 [bacterium]|nr:hypothetical protein [candidate division CSSED10-310 bacterium]